ncbi:MAG: hypothetical protein KA139_00750, partial [Rhodobacteraceae bacterium]|nr:hypothetical protein [Paracoccaceae bacterium]
MTINDRLHLSAPEGQIFHEIGQFSQREDQSRAAVQGDIGKDGRNDGCGKNKSNAVGHDPSGYCRSRPITPATSAMRQEKPHSLSY